MITVTTPARNYYFRESQLTNRQRPVAVASFQGKNNEQKSRLIMFFFVCKQLKCLLEYRYWTAFELEYRIPGLTPGYIGKRGPKLCQWGYLTRRPCEHIKGSRVLYEYRSCDLGEGKGERLLKWLPADRFQKLFSEIYNANTDIFAVQRPDQHNKVHLNKNAAALKPSRKEINEFAAKFGDAFEVEYQEFNTDESE
jgi:hypothetical protein